MPKVKSAHSRPIETLLLQHHIHEDKIYCVMIYLFEMLVWILITKLGLPPVIAAFPRQDRLEASWSARGKKRQGYLFGTIQVPRR